MSDEHENRGIHEPGYDDQDYPVSDWQFEVANGDTRLGYVEWLNGMLQAYGYPEDMTVDEYGDWLQSPESNVPGEVIRDKDGVWFCRGGNADVGANGFCQWHNDTDVVYAVGSTIIAGQAVPLEMLRRCVRRLKEIRDNGGGRTQRDLVHLDWLIDLSVAALKMSPSEEVQYVEL